MSVQLTYNIPEENLKGTFGGEDIDCPAGSGGRAGSKTKGAVNWYLQNNALATAIHRGSNLFGPLPMGYYYMHPHEVDPHKVRLEPFAANIMHKRSGFLIHGRGPIGSHGCIVPYDFHDVVKVCKAVKSYIASTKEQPVLRVIAQGTDLDKKFYTA